jgi:hypothetical protein
MDIEKILKNISREILIEIKTNSAFRSRIVQSIEQHIEFNSTKPARTNRRKQGVFDPMFVYNSRQDTLKPRLEELAIDELKDIIAEHGMDRAKLAMKWKSKERLIDLIITTVHNRSQKGDAFRAENKEQNITNENISKDK